LLQSRHNESIRETFLIDPVGDAISGPINAGVYNATVRPWFAGIVVVVVVVVFVVVLTFCRCCSFCCCWGFAIVYGYLRVCFNWKWSWCQFGTYCCNVSIVLLLLFFHSFQQHQGLSSVVAIYEDLEPPVFFDFEAPYFVTSNKTTPTPPPSQRPIKIVIAADLSLQFLTTFLSNLRIGKTGEAFVVDRSGVFVATSQPTRLSSSVSLATSLVHVSMISDELINKTMTVLLAQNTQRPIDVSNHSDYFRLQNVSTVFIQVAGKQFRVSASRFITLDWYVVVLVPDDDYVSSATWNFYVALIIGLCITFVVAVLFFLFAAIVTRPLQRMRRNMEIITKDLNFVDDNEDLSHLSEMDSMQQSFFRLKKGLLSFSRYVPLSVVRLLIANNASAELGVEPCEATSFFSDIAGFTSLSEAISPATLMIVLEEYFDSMSGIISKHSGVVGDYIGDAIFAFW
jgi:hypothetical protein